MVTALQIDTSQKHVIRLCVTYHNYSELSAGESRGTLDVSSLESAGRSTSGRLESLSRK